MEAVAIVTGLALLQLFVFAFQVGKMRVKHGVKAPAVSGHEEFERMFRVHMNTLEQIVIFLPALWLFALYVNPLIAAGLGLLFIIGRFVYRASYLVDPGKRSMGFTLGWLPMMALLIGGMIGALLKML
ncbi:MAPEG family protein [Woeseia oceani]|uniref:MAPEG family protein n=1 Tax=Woeseia oceani TaxID=1548547 RepID=A0A193LGR8_9GAMM|nr:MAPEG family protein [Woeseia oceani]ANO51656.1 hypothetical protein BA177_10970 [Woeseia oceani]